MIAKTFTEIAADVENWAQAAPDNARAHVLVRALETAAEHDIGDVRAFAEGCDENPFARDLAPRLTIGGLPDDGSRVRIAIAAVFAQGHAMAWGVWKAPLEPQHSEDPRDGLLRFLNHTTPVRKRRMCVPD